MQTKWLLWASSLQWLKHIQCNQCRPADCKTTYFFWKSMKNMTLISHLFLVNQTHVCSCLCFVLKTLRLKSLCTSWLCSWWEMKKKGKLKPFRIAPLIGKSIMKIVWRIEGLFADIISLSKCQLYDSSCFFCTCP